VGIVEDLLKLVHNTGAWRIPINCMAVIWNYLKVKHKVVLCLAIRAKAVFILIVVICDDVACVIKYSQLKSSFAKLAIQRTLDVVDINTFVAKFQLMSLK
jgi:hypothetical protein